MKFKNLSPELREKAEACKTPEELHMYDCFPRCKANGGRHYLGQQYPSHWMHVYNLNKDHDFIAQVAHPERLEVMVNELCAPGCPVRKRLLCG